MYGIFWRILRHMWGANPHPHYPYERMISMTANMEITIKDKLYFDPSDRVGMLNLIMVG